MKFWIGLVALLVACAPASAQFSQGKKFGGSFGFSAPSAAVGGTTYTSSILAFGNGGTGPSATVLNFLGPDAGGGGSLWSSTENHVQIPVSVAGTIRNLKVILTGNAISGGCTTAPCGWDIVLRKNGLSQALACTVTGNGSATPVVCDDVADAHAVSVAQGDEINIEACPSGLAGCTLSGNSAPTTVAGISVSAILVTTDGSMMLVGTLPQSNGTGADILEGFSGNQSPVTFASGDSTVSGLFSIPGQIDQICVGTSIAAATTGQIAASLYHNGVAAAGALSTAITSSTHSGLWSCSNLSGTNTAESLVASDTASIRITSNGLGTSQGFWGASARWRPTTAGLQPVFGAGSAIPGGTRYGPLSGYLGTSASTWIVYNSVSPPYGSGNTKWQTGNLLTGMSCASPPCQTGTMSRTLLGLAGSTTPSTMFSCTMSNGTLATIGGVASTASCNSASTYALTPGSILVSVEQTVANTPPTATWLKIGTSIQATP